MAENSKHQHHHHHHHHREDDASRFKREQLNSMKRRRLISKYLFRALCIIAIIMTIAAIVLYRIE